MKDLGEMLRRFAHPGAESMEQIRIRLADVAGGHRPEASP